MPRDAGLDTARAVAMLLVVATHAALSFMVTPIGWAIQDRSQHLGVDLGVWIVRAFAMPTFFWLSGYFSRAVLHAGGLQAFARNRGWRIALPLAVALVPCSLALDALWDWGRAVGLRAAVADNVPKLKASELPIELGHLWFLYYLLLLSVAAVVVTRLVAARRWMLALPVAMVVCPILWLGALQPDTPLGFVPDVPIALYAGGFFAWGWLVHAFPEELARYRRYAGLALAIAALPLAVVCVTLYRGLAAIEHPPVHAVLASGAFSLLVVAGFLGLCARQVRPSPLLQLASEASYWTYIAHLPLVVLLQILLARVAVPGPLKLVAIVAATTALCVGSYAVFRNARRIRSPQR